jgi:hypothetical protein
MNYKNCGMKAKKKATPHDSPSWPRWPRIAIPGQLPLVHRIIWWFLVLYLVGGWGYLLFCGVILWRIFRQLPPNF